MKTMENKFRQLVIIAVLILLVSRGVSQTLQSVGLRGKVVYDLRILGGTIYAGTDDGVFVHLVASTDTLWKQVGFAGHHVPALYCSQSPTSMMIELLASIQRESGDTLSPLMFITGRTCAMWAPADRGINRSNGNRRIVSLDGFPVYSPGSEIYAVGNGDVFRYTDSVWKNIYSIGVGVTNVVRANPFTSSVWVGGETGIMAPTILHSHDNGKTWIWSTPSLGGDNACYSFAFDPLDTLVVYAGMEGSVVKSTDGGQTWQKSGLRDTPYYIFALTSVQSGNHMLIFAGGSALPTQSGTPEYGLYMNRDNGLTWIPMTLAGGTKGIRCFASEATSMDGYILFAGTLGDGVYLVQENPTDVQQPVQPANFRLEQNYPNPFNPSTSISYSIPQRAMVSLKVLDVLGREVKILESGIKNPGTYKTDFNGRSFASGVYFIRLQVGLNVDVKRCVLVK